MDTIGYFSNIVSITALNQLEPNRYDYVILDKAVDAVRLPDVQQQLTTITFLNITNTNVPARNTNVLLKDINGVDIITSRPDTSIELVPAPALNRYIIGATSELSVTTGDAPIIPNLKGTNPTTNKTLWKTVSVNPLWHAFNIDNNTSIWLVPDNNPEVNYIYNPMPYNVTKMSIVLQNTASTISHIKITGGNGDVAPTTVLFDKDVNFTNNNIVHSIDIFNRNYYTTYGFGLTITGAPAKEIRSIQLYGSY